MFMHETSSYASFRPLFTRELVSSLLVAEIVHDTHPHLTVHPPICAIWRGSGGSSSIITRPPPARCQSDPHPAPRPLARCA